MEAQQQAHERALTSTVSANECDSLSLANSEGHIFQDAGTGRVVTEAEVLKAHLVRLRKHRHKKRWPRADRNRCFEVQSGAYPRERCPCSVKVLCRLHKSSTWRFQERDVPYQR